MEKNEIERKANEILKEYSISTENGVDIVELCKRNGFIILSANLEQEDGVIVVNDHISNFPGYTTNKIIAVNSKHSYEFKRFVIAHEFGHYILREKSGGIIAARGSLHGRNDNENDIDYFAACLLMPKDAFVKKFHILEKTCKDTLEQAQALAKAFSVPLRSAVRRMEETDLIKAER